MTSGSGAPLRLWWVVASGLVVAVVLAALAHPLRATFVFAATLLLAAAARAVLPVERLGGLVVRSRWVDVSTLLLLGLAVGIIGRAMNLHPNV